MSHAPSAPSAAPASVSCLPVVSAAPRGQAERLYAANQGLIGFVLARRFSRLPPALREDAEAWARLGLWYAASHFDPARGVKFSSYAHQCVFGYIHKLLRNEARQLLVSCLSLDAPLLTGEGDTRTDLLADSRADFVPALLDREGLGELVAGLHPTQQDVMIRLYAEGDTLQTVADELGITRQRLHQRHCRALGQLRQALGAGE